jgi:hypothetical protein
MDFIDIIFAVGLLLLTLGLYSAVSLVRLSASKTKDELKDLSVANLWVVFLICVPVGLSLIYFWF